MSIEIAKERVQRGAALLDERYPNWALDIDLSILDLASINCCVLGQMFGGFGKGVHVLFNHSYPEAAAHGFTPALSGDGITSVETQPLWVEAIKERLLPTVKWTFREEELNVKDDGGSAFPHQIGWASELGMTLRDYFASQALGAVYADNARIGVYDPKEAAHEAYEVADAMLKERSK